MAITELPLVSALKTRMHWQQTRQKLLAENVANADLPNFKPRDLREPSAGGGAGQLAVAVTNPMHMSGTLAAGSDPMNAARFETRPSGSGVNIEDEMMKVAQNQADYQLATSLYQKSLAMLKTAVGKAGG